MTSGGHLSASSASAAGLETHQPATVCKQRPAGGGDFQVQREGRQESGGRERDEQSGGEGLPVASPCSSFVQPVQLSRVCRKQPLVDR